MVEEALSQRRPACGKEFRKIDTVRLGDVPYKLQRLETVCGKLGDHGLVVEQMFAIEAEHRQHTRLNDDDRSSAVEVGAQHLRHGAGLPAGGGDHALRHGSASIWNGGR